MNFLLLGTPFSIPLSYGVTFWSQGLWHQMKTVYVIQLQPEHLILPPGRRVDRSLINDNLGHFSSDNRPRLWLL